MKDENGKSLIDLKLQEVERLKELIKEKAEMNRMKRNEDAIIVKKHEIPKKKKFEFPDEDERRELGGYKTLR